MPEVSLLTNPVVSNGSPMEKSSVFAGSWLALGLVLAWALVAPQAEARAFFVFGDSLVDSGNNDYLFTTARADSPPYGIDYPTGRPTGRFSNGLNIPDILSNLSFIYFGLSYVYIYSLFMMFQCRYHAF